MSLSRANSSDGAISRIRKLTDQACLLRDGITLSTDVYLPDSQGPFPTLLCRTPYDKGTSEREVPDAVFFAQRGYAVALQDVRGRYSSEGQWSPFAHEVEDGSDAIAWTARQPWSNGKVGMYGGSYCGFTQLQAAQSGNPHLLAISPRSSFDNLYRQIYPNGALRLETFLTWSIYTYNRVNHPILPCYPNELTLNEMCWRLPLVDMLDPIGLSQSWWRDWIGHAHYGDYWRNLRPPDEHYRQIRTPALHTVGWFDFFLQGGLRNFAELCAQASRDGPGSHQKLIIGPWAHGERPNKTKTWHNDAAFGEKAFIDMRQEELRWFDYWLKDVDNGTIHEACVKYFVMGENRWSEADSWPLPEARYTKLYLRSYGNADTLSHGGLLSRELPGQEPPESYLYDPMDPVSTYLGIDSNLAGPNNAPYVYCLAERDERRDVLVYSTQPLDHNVRIVGPVQLQLYASSSARDTDFVARLVDVLPDGHGVIVSQGVLRARYRESRDLSALLQPGAIYRFEIEMSPTSNCFITGHCIRLELTSSDFPQYDRNPNTGRLFGQDTECVQATQTIFHDSSHPSHIILPVVGDQLTNGL